MPPWPCCSAATPGYAPGVSTSDTIGKPCRSARSIARIALRYPSGFGMPNWRFVRSWMSRPFWWPTSTTVRPSSLAMPLTSAPSSDRPRSPCSSNQSSSIRST